MEAATLCTNGTLWKYQVQRFTADRLCQCRKLQKEVLSGQWHPTPVVAFTLKERGKIRRVMPVNMRDRVVERCLCEHVLVPFVEATAIKDSSACIRGRGLEYATGRIREHLKTAPPGAWVFQFDFHDYFHTIDRRRLKTQLDKRVPECFVELIGRSIGGFDGVGLELGSHVCQLLAVWYLTPLDKMIQLLPGFHGYHRYMDDGLAIFDTKNHALEAMKHVTWTARQIGLQMNEKKTFCNRATAPLVFCKTRFVKRGAKVRMTVRKEQTRKTVRHVRRVVRKAERTEINIEPLRGSCAGSLNRADNKMARLLDERIPWPE